VRETVTPPTVAVVGAGSVGATTAYAMLVRGAARRVVLYDINTAKVEAEAADIAHGVSFMPTGEIIGSDDIESLRGARVVIVTAGAKQHPGQSRLDLASSTVGLMRELMPRLVEVAPDAIYVMVTNPVDVVTYAALRFSGLPPHQLFGSGTVLDTSRLRYEVARRIGVAPRNVHAYIAGEHGDSEFPVWSSAFVGAVPLLDWEKQTGQLTQPERDEIAELVVNAAYRIIEGKGATNFAVALAVTQILESVLRDERSVMPVTTLLDDYLGISDVCLSVPTVVEARGAVQRLVVPLSDGELELLRASADSIRATARRLGL
jgi:L-lactate dehydrogenase